MAKETPPEIERIDRMKWKQVESGERRLYQDGLKLEFEDTLPNLLTNHKENYGNTEHKRIERSLEGTEREG